MILPWLGSLRVFLLSGCEACLLVSLSLDVLRVSPCKAQKMVIFRFVFTAEKHSLLNVRNLLALDLEGATTRSLALLLLILWASTAKHLEEVCCSPAHSRVYECLNLLVSRSL